MARHWVKHNAQERTDDPADHQGRPLPNDRYIDTAVDGHQTGTNAHSHIVGYYDARTELTKDHRFHTVGIGNRLAALIADH